MRDRSTRFWAVASGTSLMVCVWPESAAACNSCFGNAEGPMIDGARAGIWLLLGVTVLMQGAFATFFLYLRRQARRAADQGMNDDWTRPQQTWDGPRSSEHP